MTARLVDLSHRVEMGMFTHPGLPGPTWEAFRSREQYRESSGTDFQVDRVTLVGNTGTYLDSPFHRFADGGDLASLPLSAVADLPVLVVDARGSERGVGPDVLAGALDAAGDAVTGAAVLLHTGGDRAWRGAGRHRRRQHRRSRGRQPPGAHPAAGGRRADPRAPDRARRSPGQRR